ncbi:hypothetical protein IKQ21_06240 [bacterium]|nr:hypothetical protein [bacterium]
MKVLPITQRLYCVGKNQKSSVNTNKRQNTTEFLPVYYPVNFEAKVINIEAEKSNLIRRFNAILKRNTARLSDEEIVTKMTNAITKFFDQKFKKLKNLESQARIIKASGILSATQKQESLNNLRKDYNRTQKSLPNCQIAIGPEDELTDFLLINKFKSAISDDNFNLKKVFLKHYEPLNNIKTIEELNEQFPSIDTPLRPEFVTAKKIAQNLTKEFYLTLDEFHQNGDENGAKEYMKKVFMDILSNAFGKHLYTFDEPTAARIVEAVGDAIITRYESLAEKNMLDSLPIKIKQKTPIISENDIALLKVDYDDFVLSVIRDIYLNFKKPNDIIYSKDNNTIKVAKIKDNPYKFEKLDETLKRFISDSETIKNFQREYHRYSDEELRNRILFITDRMGNNERLLEKLVEFDSCMFTNEDKQQLHILFRKLDSVFDEDKTLEQVMQEIAEEDIRPHGTAKINEAERNKAYTRLKEEQRAASKLRAILKNFDDAINVLYINNLNYAAEIASEYRPKSLEGISDGYKFIIDTIMHHTNKNLEITEKNTIQREILYWDKYNEQKNDTSELLEKAKKFATNENGTINEIKAGGYLFNHGVVSAYPETGEYNKEILELIMKNFGENKEKAVKYLCKYDEYKTLCEKHGQKIGNLTKIFNSQDSDDKILLKHIIKKDYITSDTSATAAMGKNNSVKTTISAKAKQEIYDYYRFPKCIEFYEAFENAMTIFASKKSSAGIKNLGRNNNSLTDIIELKILGYDDRLVSYDGTYYFNEFTPVGRH